MSCFLPRLPCPNDIISVIMDNVISHPMEDLYECKGCDYMWKIFSHNSYH